MTQDRISLLQSELDGLDAGASLTRLAARFPGQVVLSSSFSWEDQVLTHLVFSQALAIEVFTLDTGRLFPETYSTWSRTLEKYGRPITPYYPQAVALQQFIAEKGPNCFYESVENRKQCCHLRKVEPLQRALAGREVWVTGIRAEHSPDRREMPQLEWDPANRIVKFHPLLHWTTEQVTAFIREQEIPYNPLHDRGFVSIGCAPCTRAVRPGEDFRAGRWWWEDSSKKECGLHVHAAVPAGGA
ncbi:MAG TPA: phosphoadenylyl-sulfate reductase [Chitinophagaceae bacterium]|nr:phosphoadenylyl-sulfate reductase [Chitinophagaceae bacterium]